MVSSSPVASSFAGTHGEESFAKQMPRRVSPLSLAQVHRPGDVCKKEVAHCVQPAALPKLLPRSIAHQGTRDSSKQRVGGEEEEPQGSSGGAEAQQWQNHQQLEAGTAAAPADPAAGEEGYTDAGNCPG